MRKDILIKVLSANTEQLKGFIPKARFDEVNNAPSQEDIKGDGPANETLKSTVWKTQALPNNMSEVELSSNGSLVSSTTSSTPKLPTN